MSLTDYGENLVMNAIVAGNRYLALFTTSPIETGGGVEVSGGAYARQAITFSAPSGGASYNSTLIQFPTATASWGSVTAFAIFDAATGGNMLWYGAVSDANGNPTTKQVAAGDIQQVPVNALRLSAD